MKNQTPLLSEHEPVHHSLPGALGGRGLSTRLPTFAGVRRLFGFLDAACFEIVLPDRSVLHLSVALPSHEDVYAVVLVDAKRFLSL